MFSSLLPMTYPYDTIDMMHNQAYIQKNWNTGRYSVLFPS